MATVSKLLIRLQKFSSKISTLVDATDSFNANNNFYMIFLFRITMKYLKLKKKLS